MDARVEQYIAETSKMQHSFTWAVRSKVRKNFTNRNFCLFLQYNVFSTQPATHCRNLENATQLFWIKEFGTAKPYGFNDQIKGVGTLSSISCKKTNICSLFNKQPRRKRSRGKRRYNKRAPQPDITMSTLVDLVDMIEKPEGVHKINTKLFSI